MPSREGSTPTAWNGKSDYENLRSNGGAKWENGTRKATKHHVGLCQKKLCYSLKKRNILSNKKEGMERGTKRTTPMALTCGRKKLKQVNRKFLGERQSIMNLW